MLFAIGLVSINTVQGRESNESQTVHIVITSPETEVDEGLRLWVDGLISQLQTNLALQGLELVRVEPFTLGIEMEVRIFNFPSENLISVIPQIAFPKWNEILSDLSPLLIASSVPLGPIYVTRDIAGAETAEQLVTALLFYSVQRCEAALPYFDNFLNNLQISSSTYGFFTTTQWKSLTAFHQGNCALLNSEFDLAIGYFERARWTYEDFIFDSPIINLSWIYIQQGQQGRAFNGINSIVDYNRAQYLRCNKLRDECGISARHGLIYILTLRSQFYALANRYDEAIADMDAAIEIDSGNPRLYVERGQRISLIYEWDRALVDYDTALQLNPNYADAYYYRGLLYASAPPFDNSIQYAVADFEQYLTLAPEGEHAEDAERYLTQLQAQLEALATPAGG